MKELENKIEKLIGITDIPIEKKQSKNFTFYYKREVVKTSEILNYIYFKRDKNIYTAHSYKHGIDVHNETKQIDTKLNLYYNFFRNKQFNLL